jgi:hypothetical protein
MERRSLLKGLFGIVASVGVAAKAKAIASPEKAEELGVEPNKVEVNKALEKRVEELEIENERLQIGYPIQYYTSTTYSGTSTYPTQYWTISATPTSSSNDSYIFYNVY